MTPAELRQQTLAAVEKMLDAAAEIGDGEVAEGRLCRIVTAFATTGAAAIRGRQYGVLMLEAPLVAGVPDNHAASRVGFIAKVK